MKIILNFILGTNLKNGWVRILRREVFLGVVSFLGVLTTAYLDVAPGYMVPAVAGIVGALDKFLREVAK